MNCRFGKGLAGSRYVISVTIPLGCTPTSALRWAKRRCTMCSVCERLVLWGEAPYGRSPTGTPFWPSLYIMREIGPYTYPAVSVRVHDLHSGEIAWWGENGNSPQKPILMMDPAVDQPAAKSWVSYLTLLYITHAGCYEMDVTWRGDGWRLIFAVGQESQGPEKAHPASAGAGTAGSASTAPAPRIVSSWLCSSGQKRTPGRPAGSVSRACQRPLRT